MFLAIGDTCDPPLNCSEMAPRGYGYIYYMLSAAVLMHGYLTAIHDNLQAKLR